MKKNTLINISLFAVLVAVSCKQEVIQTTEPVIVEDTSCKDAIKGSADFSKFIAIGSSYTAGFQAGALFNAGQNNSLAAILNTQFQCVGAPAAFDQPAINTDYGYNIFISPNPDPDNHIFGRFLLQYNGASSPTPTPQLSSLTALPNPILNPDFIYNGNRANLRNFSVEAILLGQFLSPATGDFTHPDPALGFSPFYARFASDGGAGTSTIIGDAAAVGGSFFFFWGGMDDFMLYAANGGDQTRVPHPTPASGAGQYGFDVQYGGAIGLLLGSNPNLKGVVANFPDIFKMPHFTSVPWNAIVFTSSASDAANITATNTAYAPYNGGLDAALAGGAGALGLTQAEVDKRKINFVVGANGIVIEDESLTDLSGFGLPSIRQATENDIFPLSAGGVLGTEETPGDPTTTWGVGKALTDQYVLIPAEVQEIVTARAAYNTIVAGTQANFSDRVALADVGAAMDKFASDQVYVMNGVTVTFNIDPPTGIYSEDGIHPNSRGYAYISTVIIDAINKKFGSTVPLTNVAKYSATALPIP